MSSLFLMWLQKLKIKSSKMSHIYKKVNSQIVNVEILRNSVFGGWGGRKSWLGSVSPVIVWLVIIYFEARLWEWPLEYPWQYPSEVQVSHSELHVRLLRINAFWFMTLSIRTVSPSNNQSFSVQHTFSFGHSWNPVSPLYDLC